MQVSDSSAVYPTMISETRADLHSLVPGLGPFPSPRDGFFANNGSP
jgi:hypothetical protein